MTKVTVYAKNIEFCGDLHGEFHVLEGRLREVENTCIFICGDIGFGFPNYTVPFLKYRAKDLDPLLEERGNTVVLIRGNHDDPVYFQDAAVRDSYGTARFIPVADYTMVGVKEAKNKAPIKVLCIGGAISIDYAYRTPYRSWWPKEGVEYVEIADAKSLDILCTHTSFIKPKELGRYITPDLRLMNMLYDEELNLKKIYDYYQPKIWFHGHYHESDKQRYEETDVVSLNCGEFYSYVELGLQE